MSDHGLRRSQYLKRVRLNQTIVSVLNCQENESTQAPVIKESLRYNRALSVNPTKTNLIV